MKKIIFLLLITLSTISVNAQLKVFSTGKTSLGTTAVPPSNINTQVFGNYIRLFGCNSLNLDVSCCGPRIWGFNNSVVFFNTTTGVYNDIQCRVLTEHSDSTAKTNISTVSDGLNKILKLRGVTYNFKSDISNNKNTSKKHSGLLAQEVENVIPESVITADSTGQKSISYSSIIPYLIEAIKEQNTKIVALEEAAKKQFKSAELPTNISGATLGQNVPNPFNENTTIEFYLPTTVQSALLCIYDMQGKQIKSISVTDREAGNVVIHASELQSGMYYYSLIADGNVIGTETMILTE